MHAALVRSSFVSMVLGLLIVSQVLAGSAGIKNGAIQGVVYDGMGQPVGGASVVAVRQMEPKIIRSTTTDAMGNFFLGDLYLGEYLLGFSKYGYKTIDTGAGNANSPSPTGNQIRASVESGRASIVSAVYMDSMPDASNGVVNLTLLDRTTGQPVTDASVNLGSASVNSGTSDGVYSLSTPALWDSATQSLKEQTLYVAADGFDNITESVQVVPNGTVNKSIRLAPKLGGMAGIARSGISALPIDYTKLSIRVRNLSSALANPVVSPNGAWSVSVPTSTSSITRRYTLEFSMLNYKTKVISNIVMPIAGGVTVPDPVVLEPEMVDVTGQVLLQDQSVPSGSGYDQVVVTELGKAATISNGTYMLRLPVGQKLTFNVTAKNKSGMVESAKTEVTPVSDGSTSPVYVVPIIFTSGSGTAP